ncbi:MAG: amidase [Rhodospirillales bacterium]|jgi:amidase|nr:amidase [Rhodospirillales bacterium]MBT4040879.1 amidase [Rhodospirillales bacterium]MBT4628156.1 amidase [Rhodospirillales bacterium]MBT5351968.1 amidase [Rhodospirillales bacterium]MBT5521119.1 amidase [Rhodospirillales bacterium]
MLTRDEYRACDALDLAALVKAGEVSALELLESAIAEIERLNPALNATIMRNFDLAREQAKQVDPDAPLAGVPFAAKDINVHVAGFPSTHACRFFDGAPAQNKDSLLVERWRRAGLVIPVRTNTPEFATDFGCEPELYGPTNNPWDLSRTPGGSSGGAGAAVASGMFPMAHATDSGGSIRVPASCCGLFGLKPSSGLVATGSPLAPLVNGMNCDHALSWTVRDSAALLDVTAGPEIGAPISYARHDGAYLDAVARPPSGLRIGMCLSSPAGHTPNAEIETKVHDTVTLLEGLGHTVVPWTWPGDVDPFDAAADLWAADVAIVIAERAAELGRAPTEAELGPVIHWCLELANSNGAVDYVQSRVRFREIQMTMAEATADIDVLLTPVVTEPPLKTGLLTDLVNRDVTAWSDRGWQFAPYPEIFNVTGQPAMSVPLHQGEDGLPIGMQFAAGVGQDALLLSLAGQLEQAAPWRDRRPPDPVG